MLALLLSCSCFLGLELRTHAGVKFWTIFRQPRRSDGMSHFGRSWLSSQAFLLLLHAGCRSASVMFRSWPPRLRVQVVMLFYVVEPRLRKRTVRRFVQRSGTIGYIFQSLSHCSFRVVMSNSSFSSSFALSLRPFSQQSGKDSVLG